MADDDDDLGEEDYEEEILGFPPADRRISTTAYDLSVNTLVEQWDEGLLVIPAMQREYVWDNGRASRLVESLMLNIPVPPVFFSETKDAKYEVIDGHQRIRSVVRYVNNEFPLSGLRLGTEFNRMRFHQLPAREQRFLKTRVMRAIIIGIESHPLMQYEIFSRLNTGSIALNSQEIRHALNQGSFNDLLHSLATNADFRHCLGSKTPRKRMVDEELVLRFFTLSAGLDDYRPPLLRALNLFMEENRSAKPKMIASLKASFDAAAAFNAAVFPEVAYRPTDKQGRPLERNVNRAVFDAQMVVASWVQSGKPSAAVRKKILAGAAALYQNEDFQDAIQRATGDRKRTLTRVTMWAAMLQEAGVDVDVPHLS